MRGAQARLQFTNLRLDQTLLLAGSVVVGVLLEVSVGARVGDTTGNDRSLGKQLFELLLHLGVIGWGDDLHGRYRSVNYYCGLRAEARTVLAGAQILKTACGG